jgi:hypothetical protein
MMLTDAGFAEIKQEYFGNTRSTLVARAAYDMFPELLLYMEAEKPKVVVHHTEDDNDKSVENNNSTNNYSNNNTTTSGAAPYDPLAGQGQVEVVGEEEKADRRQQEWLQQKKIVPAAVASGGAKPDKLSRIALISPTFLRTPPTSYGGLELVVANLGRELARRGCYDVTVFAAENSYVEGCKMINTSKEVGTVDVDWLETERKSFEIAKPYLLLEGGSTQYVIIHGSVTAIVCWGESKPEMMINNILHTHHGGGFLGPRTAVRSTRRTCEAPSSTWWQYQSSCSASTNKASFRLRTAKKKGGGALNFYSQV